MKFKKYNFIILLILLQVGILRIPVRAQNLQSSKISVNFNAKKLTDILPELEKLTGLRFEYQHRLFDNNNPKITWKAEQQAVATVLNKIFENTTLSYSQTGSSILIVSKPTPIKKQSPGRISGKVYDELDGTPIAGATIYFDGSGASSDTAGLYHLTVPVGTHSMTVSYMGYTSKRITDILVREGKVFTLHIPMTRDKGQLAEVVISARKIIETGTNLAIINEIREADAVVSGISKEQISRSQDRDAAEVVRRIPGVSVMQNRFIVVRGLPQRYNTVMLNGTVAPSFEPDSRAFSFDIMPSSMIDRIMVYKTAVPELPGDFAGGVVRVYTTGMPVKNAFNITFQSSFLQNSSLRSFYEQPRGSKAWLGYDDGTYAMPKAVEQIRNEQGRIDVLPVTERRPLGKLFNDNWESGQRTAPLDKRLNIDFARKLVLANKLFFGLVSAVSYSDTYSHQSTARNTGIFAGGENKFDREYTYADQSYEHNTRINGLLNLALDYKGNHHVEFKNLYTHLGTLGYIDRIGLAGTYATSRDADKYVGYKVMTNTYRGIYLGQVSGQHSFFSKSTIVDWVLAYGRSNYNYPDQRIRFFDANPAVYYGKNSLLETGLTNQVLEYNRGRQYIELPDTSKTIAVNVVQKFKILGMQPHVKAGIFIEDKTRSFEMVQLGREQDNPSYGPGWVINEVFGRENSYTASNLLQAGYLAAEIPAGVFKINGGLRIEKNSQKLNTYAYGNKGDLAESEIRLNKKNTSYLPSVNLQYSLSAKSLIRAVYAKTLNRPEFREIATFFYKDFNTGRLAYGNPELKTQTDINNIDFRFEHYPGVGEMLNVGLFYKKFQNPIEFYYYAGTNGRSNFDWGNAKSAKNYGAEVEFVLGLLRYFSDENWTARQLQKMAVLFNAAYIKSEVDLGEKAGLQDMKRPMYGQSPYLFNSSVNYNDEKKGLKITASHNVIGKRIFSIGNTDSPSIYEMPRNVVDLTFSKQFSKIWEIKGGIQNLLNAPHRLVQDVTRDGKFKVTKGEFGLVDNLYENYYTSPYYTLGIGIKL